MSAPRSSPARALMTIVACACALALASGAALAQPKSTRRPGAAATPSKKSVSKKSLAAPGKPSKDPKKRADKDPSHSRADQEKNKANSRGEKLDKNAKAPRKGAGRAEARPASPSKSTRGTRQASRRAGDAGAGRARRPLSSPPPLRTPPPPPRASLPILEATIRCPADMVAVAGRVCVDRYEASLVSRDTGADLSPYYPPSPAFAASLFTIWSSARESAPAGTLARLLPIPALPEGAAASFLPRAIAEPGRVPSGYTSGAHAAEACSAAGKRLCSEAEWVTACRGEAQTPFPYGVVYRQDACNVFREEHPAHVLHGTFSTNHLDPRLNQIEVGGRPLLRKTGDTPSCASRWGDDAIFDMVGNLDEWIDDPAGTFVGGFYARATRRGCDARIAGHPIDYLDYSTGVRCCKDPDP